MTTKESIEEQLKTIGFKYWGWGRTEVGELHNIILPDEEIYECVNGLYEGGFALLVATNFRLVLVDKKPLRYLTVEDLRFDMISEIDYSHRLIAAQINISTGSRNLRFISLNQQRLRKLIGHVQHCMADSKKKQSEHEEDQKLHLEQINQQLHIYLLAQQRQQQKIQEQLEKNNQFPSDVEPIRPSPELFNYLREHGLLDQPQYAAAAQAAVSAPSPLPPVYQEASAEPSFVDLYNEGIREVFGKKAQSVVSTVVLNPLQIAYSKLPLAMRNKKFGRPSFHDHSQKNDSLPLPQIE